MSETMADRERRRALEWASYIVADVEHALTTVGADAALVHEVKTLSARLSDAARAATVAAFFTSPSDRTMVDAPDVSQNTSGT